MPHLRVVIFAFLTLAICTPKNSVYAQDAETIRDTLLLKLNAPTSLDTSSCNVLPLNYRSKKFALVLSGGGARGISQIGVLNGLESKGISPDLIVGTSIGSIIGGLYSIGYTSQELDTIFRNFDWERALSLTNKYQRSALFPEQKRIQDRSAVTIPLDGITPVIIPAALSNGLFLSEKINSLVLNARYHSLGNFGQLRIPFAAVATDINSGKRAVLTTGDLSLSIKASMTFPLLYSPIRMHGKELVDGGLTANIPALVAKDLGADYIVAINTTSPLKHDQELEDPLSTADQILSITMAQLNDMQLKEADLVITPDLGKHGITEYSEFDKLVGKGELSANLNAERIAAALDSMEASGSKYINNFITNATLRLTIEKNLTDTAFRISDLMPGQFERYTDIESNLRKLYRSGYFRSVKAVVERSGMVADVNYVLEPNGIFFGFRVLGMVSANVSNLLNVFTSEHSGKTLNVNSFNKLRDDILGVLRRDGFAFVTIERLYFESGTGLVELSLSGGDIDKIVIEGNKTTNTNVIGRELKLRKGLTVSSAEIDGTLQNIMSTNLFEQVSLNYTEDKNTGSKLLKVSVSEKNTKALRLSARVDNVLNFQVYADLRDENLFGTALEAGLIAGGGLRNRIFRGEFKSNQLFSLPLTFNLNGFYQFRDIYTYLQVNDDVDKEFEAVRTGEYRNIASGFSFLAGSQLERLGTIYGQIFLENLSIKPKSGNDNLNEDNDIAKFRFGGFFDTQDKWPFPTTGFFFDFIYETAKNLNDGNLSYTKLFLNYHQYVKLGKRHTLRPRLMFGFGDKTTPISDQFSLGGDQTFYGMVEDEMRGRQVLAASIEYRFSSPYKFLFDTYLGARLDLGNVWNFADDIRFKDLRQGIGAFISVDTPIGEGSVSAGRSFFTKGGLQGDAFYFGPYVFYFSIGYQF